MFDKLAKTFEVVEDWDCDFLFTLEEIVKWRHEDFYCFILGQHTLHGKVNSQYRSNWKESNYYKRGKARAFRKSKSTNNYKFKKGMVFGNVNKIIARTINIYHKSFIRYKGSVLEVSVPQTRRTKFEPIHGLNFTPDADKGPYLYNIRDKQFVFIWKKVAEDMPFDFTALLYGRGNWPDRLAHVTLNFDVEWIEEESVREYHFINYLLSRKKRSWAQIEDWQDFKELLAKRGTIY